MLTSTVKDVSSLRHHLPLDTPSGRDSEEYALFGAINAGFRLVNDNPLERSPDIEQSAASFGDDMIGSSSGDAIVPADIAGRDQVSRSIRYQR